MTKLLSKIDIHPLTWIVLLSGLMTGYIKYMILVILIILIHETGHIIIACLLKREIQEVCLLPFGGYVKMDSIISSDITEDLFIASGGMFFQTIFGFMLIILYKFNLIDKSIFEFLNSYNIIIILFNLIPISPLDGAKIFRCILELFVPFRKVFVIIYLLSVSFLVIITFLNFKIILDNVFVFGFLVVSSFLEYKNRRYILNRFYLERITHEFSYPYKKIKRYEDMYKNHRHHINGIEEREYLLINVYKT